MSYQRLYSETFPLFYLEIFEDFWNYKKPTKKRPWKTYSNTNNHQFYSDQFPKQNPPPRTQRPQKSTENKTTPIPTALKK